MCPSEHSPIRLLTYSTSYYVPVTLEEKYSHVSREIAYYHVTATNKNPQQPAVPEAIGKDFTKALNWVLKYQQAFSRCQGMRMFHSEQHMQGIGCLWGVVHWDVV